MIPLRFVIVDERTGVVVNVVTVEDGNNFDETPERYWIENRTSQIGDHVSIDNRQKRYYPAQRTDK